LKIFALFSEGVNVHFVLKTMFWDTGSNVFHLETTQNYGP